MADRLTIYELTKYYTNRYELPLSAMGGTPYNQDDGMGRYYGKLVRLLKDTKVGQIRLYDAIRTKDGGGRAITIDEFERFCLEAWAEYLMRTCAGEFNEKPLLADLERWKLEFDREFWEQKAEGVRQKTLEALANGTYNPPMEDDGTSVISDEEVAEKGHWMMVEALYDVVFDGFAWDKLRKDMETADITPEEDSQADFTGDMLRAKKRLKSYWNYVGKRKDIK